MFIRRQLVIPPPIITGGGLGSYYDFELLDGAPVPMSYIIYRVHTPTSSPKRTLNPHAKGNNETSVPLLATTKAALESLPAAPIKHLVITAFGKPFSEAGLGNRMRKWCDVAGLPQCSLHGLRKAVSRQLAEHGATDAEGQAITGHKKAATFAHYRAKANRANLADRAFSNMETK